MERVGKELAALSDQYRGIAAVVEKAEEERKKVLAELTFRVQEVRAGFATTGDTIKDFVVAHYGCSCPQLEEAYRDCITRVSTHKGELLLMVDRPDSMRLCMGISDGTVHFVGIPGYSATDYKRLVQLPFTSVGLWWRDTHMGMGIGVRVDPFLKRMDFYPGRLPAFLAGGWFDDKRLCFVPAKEPKNYQFIIGNDDVREWFQIENRMELYEKMVARLKS